MSGAANEGPQLCEGDGRPCYVSPRTDDAHWRCGTGQCGSDYLSGRAAGAWTPAEKGAPYVCPAGDMGCIIAMVMSCADGSDEIERRKHLIAAAPDMLAELKWCLIGAGSVARIAAIIARAEGK